MKLSAFESHDNELTVLLDELVESEVNDHKEDFGGIGASAGSG